MNRFLYFFLSYLTIGLVIVFSSCRSTPLQPSAKTVDVKEDLSKFSGLWIGNATETYQASNWSASYPMILDIQPKKNNEIVVTTEWPSLNETKTIGRGLVTPNFASWIDLRYLEGEDKPLCARYLAKLTQNNELKGEYIFEPDSEDEHSFLLLKADMRVLEAFNHDRLTALKRLRESARNTSFLEQSWRNLLPNVALWFEKNLQKDIKIITEKDKENLDYANQLADALEHKENYFTARQGNQFLVWLEGPESISKHISEYTVSFPPGFPQQSKKYPLLIQLHGGGDAGRFIRDTWFYKENPNDSAFIKVYPHSRTFWNVSALNSMLNSIKEMLPIDEDRIYLYGGSMGGHGTYLWAMENPEHFAAIAPICGGGSPFRAIRLRNVPVWIFHGEKDESVPFWEAEIMLSSLQEIGTDVQYTFYPEAGHNVSQFIDHPKLWQWFLQHKRTAKDHPPDPYRLIQFDQRGIGNIEIVEIPPQRFASYMIKPDDSWAVVSEAKEQMYGLYRKGEQIPSGITISQTLPTFEEGQYNLLLSIPLDMKIEVVPNNVKILDIPSIRALMYIIKTDYDQRSKMIRESMKEFEDKGYNFTGEIRENSLTFDANKEVIKIILPLAD